MTAEPDPTLAARQAAFNAAMERYERLPVYPAIGRLTSVAVVGLQLASLGLFWTPAPGPLGHLAALALAYVAADFVNGLVHVYMDGSEDYTSPVGPLVAAFHLHHRTPRYRVRHALLVWFEESGSKLWLVPTLALAIGALLALDAPPLVAHTVVYFGLLSSLAEVSHYLCHVPDPRWVGWLRRAGLLLSKRHHALHHQRDNVNYAFLNGMTDPLLNLIARRWSRGYRTTTDLHYARYEGPDTANR